MTVHLHATDSTLQVGQPARPEVSLMCSARGCHSSANWGLKWNNAKLHTPERRKTWLACDQHRESLQEFLRLRGFLRETVPVSELRAD